MNNKKILLGVSSSVAIYKALDLIRLLKKKGAVVHVIMTDHATKLISPQLFQAVSGNPVWTRLFQEGRADPMPHVSTLKDVDLMLVAPATANVIGKFAFGLADDLLTTTFLATSAPIIMAPAMNTRMFEHPLVQENIAKLTALGVMFVPPQSGELACGEQGMGHLADLETIVAYVDRAFSLQDLNGKRVLIASGPTVEPLDPVRFLSNRSSGKMGYAFAREAWRRGADVTVVSGPVCFPCAIPGVEVFNVESAEDMRKVLMRFFPQADVFISAAAVCDFRPLNYSKSKLKKKGKGLELEFVENPSILAKLLQKKRKKQVVISFALETEELLNKAKRKHRIHKSDLLVANRETVLGRDEGNFIVFEGKTHREFQGLKVDLATMVLDRTVGLLKK